MTTEAVRPLADGEPRQLDPRYIDLQQQVGWIVAAVVSAGLMLGLAVLVLAVGPAGWVLGASVAAAAAIVAGLAWLAVRWPPLEYARASFVVDDRGIEIRRGVVWRRVINVPRSRVQHTDVSQGPLERSYGLGTLVIYTAGTDHAQVDLPGLAHGTALAIRNHLLPRELSDAV
jgi:membrane protein YdbS with pleckstrin-like domain